MLRWHLKHADQMDGYRRYIERTGGIPDDLLEAPALPSVSLPCGGEVLVMPDPALQTAWRGFWALTDSRQWTMGGAAGIPYSQVTGWLDEMGIFDPEDRDEYRFLIREMDREYREASNKPKGKNRQDS